MRMIGRRAGRARILTAARAAACIAAALAIMPACAAGNGLPAGGVPDRHAAESERIVDFAASVNGGFYAAHGYSNGQMFDCTWSRDCAVIRDGVMNMSVTGGGDVYYGAEYRTDTLYRYGFYAVCMKAADCPGVISSFFTYTGRPRWDEIDIEFLGKDMTEVQFNYYTDGAGGHEYVYRLGFDASQDFHEYAFLWRPGDITWYVDGRAVYRATDNIPQMPQQIMMNVWNCKGHDEWSGKFDGSALPATAQYKWIAYSPLEDVNE